ncbi:hypothetical protein MIND_01213600 [Mycena indigotica]|uniref:DUF6593 domain-containing protein n=1 Tax=Mycena indigotica TaxID=2126181 RepID=A0A8H6S398_9AGAR|nr:uncharacterized protein MIND_01213600 [Mycena indigotica]KAF7291883.1 hypothetical protein MIND_01213600 [Mycena indigotica]
MFLKMTEISPINTVFYDGNTGRPLYKTSTPKLLGGTTHVSCAIESPLTSPEHGGAETTQFAHLASIDFHEYHIKKPSVITFRGNERVVNEWLKKEGAGRGWWGPHRPFTAEDGKDYKWLLKANHVELRTNDVSEILVACFHPRKDRLFKKGKEPAALEVKEGYEAILDEIVVTFVFLEQLRGIYDRGEEVIS